VKTYEQNDLYQNVIRPRKYDALLFGEVIGKDRDLYAFWHSSQRNAPGLNVAMYANSKVDKLLEDIRTTSDETVRATKYAQFDSLVRADIPAIFLYLPEFVYAVPKSVHNIILGSLGVPSDRWNTVGTWYTETENVWKIFTK
jgi:peptide/nickel transport system substrate-binding protein